MIEGSGQGVLKANLLTSSVCGLQQIPYMEMFQCELNTVKIQCTETDRFEQTVQGLGLNCLPVYLHLRDVLLHRRPKVSF